MQNVPGIGTGYTSVGGNYTASGKGDKNGVDENKKPKAENSAAKPAAAEAKNVDSKEVGDYYTALGVYNSMFVSSAPASSAEDLLMAALSPEMRARVEATSPESKKAIGESATTGFKEAYFNDDNIDAIAAELNVSKAQAENIMLAKANNDMDKE